MVPFPLIQTRAHQMTGIPIGLTLTFYFKAGLMGLWIGLLIALVFSASLTYIFNSRTDWDVEVDKAWKRLNVKDWVD